MKIMEASYKLCFKWCKITQNIIKILQIKIWEKNVEIFIQNY